MPNLGYCNRSSCDGRYKHIVSPFLLSTHAWCVVVFTQTYCWRFCLLCPQQRASVVLWVCRWCPLRLKNKRLLIKPQFPEVKGRGHPGVSASNICFAINNALDIRCCMHYTFGFLYVCITKVAGFDGFIFKLTHFITFVSSILFLSILMLILLTEL